MTYIQKLNAIRKVMSEKNIAAYIIPSSDPHISEYLPERYKTIEWVSGFTGSAGTLVITAEEAGLWTDSRYFVQATEQLNDTGFRLMKLKVQHAPEYAAWLTKSLPEGSKIAFDGQLASVFLAKTIMGIVEPAGLKVDGSVDLLSEIWENRPELPKKTAFLLDSKQTGQSVEEKVRAIRQEMEAQFSTHHLISSLDDLAWTANIRGSDVHCNPVVLGFLLITKDDLHLFIDREKLNKEEQQNLESIGIRLHDYALVWEKMRQLPSDSSLLLDPKRTCYSLYQEVPNDVKIIENMNPSTRLKAIKNSSEISFTRRAMEKDGVALTRFFKWLEEAISSGETLTEISISEKLSSFRALQEGYIGDSFDTIAGYKAHGALPHYKATPDSDSQLSAEGLLLIDSGGQYIDGTTDITRVVSLGKITEEEIKDYTLTLKGMIAGSTTVFPEGTRGYQIDAITRKPLWDHLRNYGHGTGHGVGFFLNVHEGPHVFNAAAVDIPIDAGTITSIEPGLYREGKYGIRIENLVLTKKTQASEFGQFLDFETLTLCYIDTRLIDKDLLGHAEIAWLNAYHSEVAERLTPYLTQTEQHWLREKTKAI